jgi:predicted GIY-YIG superfamily endonuclease
MPIRDYSKNIIYVIKCKDDNITEEYIGSTTNFRHRKFQHKSSCNNKKSIEYNQIKYNFIRENGGWDNWIMLEIEKYPCQDKREAEKKEEEIRIERKAKLNMIKAFGAKTKEEYQKIWRNDHPNHKKEEYEKIINNNPNYATEYYYRYREKLRSKYICIYCNKELCIDSKSRHNKLKHLEEINNKSNNNV